MKEGQNAARSADLPRLKAFLAAAFNDYIAARVLLSNALPLQGAIQASTAIEKYLKVFLEFRGNSSKGHLKRAHLNAVRNFAPDLWKTFNEEFFLLCQKVYDLRYPDSLPAGYNVVIAGREFLAELDLKQAKIGV
jgi:HEPN domain.